MVIRIDETDPRPIYQQIVDEIRRGVVLGALGAGEALPSVRQLAAELRVNPNTVQQAYRELERQSLAYVRRGQGTYVSELKDGGEARARSEVAETVARHALREARHHGLTAEELMAAIRAATAGDTSDGSDGRGGA